MSVSSEIPFEYPVIQLTRNDIEAEMEGEMEGWSPSHYDLRAIAGEVANALMEAYWPALREICTSYIEAYKKEVSGEG